MLDKLYHLATDLGAPLIRLFLNKRLKAGHEDASRFSERLGQASVARPTGKLIWCHAASVGEAMSVLRLIEVLRKTHPTLSILLTTGTVTSAQMLAKRLPDGVIHQYVPVDRMPYVRRFLNHWQPDLVLWVESELWPNLLCSVKQRKIPAILINGRMSEKSCRNWHRAKRWAAKLLNTFDLCLTQTQTEIERFSSLGARKVQFLGNLKYAAAPLSFHSADLLKLQNQIGERPIWLMASTHSGEETIALDVHQQLSLRWPNLLTIIAPRHAIRGGEIAQLIESRNLSFQQRSQQPELQALTSIYLADTMGELGLFYRLADIVCIGGTFTWGGHNPVEVAQLGKPIIFGPRMTNFAEIAHDFIDARAAISVTDGARLAYAIAAWLTDPTQASEFADHAKNLAKQKNEVLGAVLQAIEPYLNQLQRGTA